MLFQSHNSLENLIVLYLCQHPDKTAQEIYTYLVSKNHKYSLQGIYKELNKLDTESVLLKVDKKWNLRLPWVHEMTSFAGKIENTYLSPKFNSLLPEEGKKQIWHFDNLFKMNDLWSQILLTLVEQSREKIILGWNPHTWFHLAEAKEEEKYLKSLESSGARLYLIIGGNNYLDKWAEKYLKKPYVHYSFGKSVFQEQRSKYINVIDDYVVTIKLDDDITNLIELLYETTLSEEEMSISQIISIFNQKVEATIWLEKSPEQARLLKGRFKRYFGVEFLTN